MKLAVLQQRIAESIVRPLTPSGRMARKTSAGTSMAGEAAELIRPNDRLTSLERLEIYSRSYWFRLLDSMRDDFPGVLAILGNAKFGRLITAYLVDCPSRSFTLRDLGSQFERWLRERPRMPASKAQLVLDMVRLEWAHIVAFDGPEVNPIDLNDLATLTPAMRVRLQPCVSILDLQYPVDELRVQLNASPEGSTSKSSFSLPEKTTPLAPRGFSAEPVYVAIHRFELSVYYRRLAPEEFRILTGLRQGRPIATAIRAAFRDSPVQPDEIPGLLQTWFSAWARFGWLTLRTRRK
jgi:hypothetical protein